MSFTIDKLYIMKVFAVFVLTFSILSIKPVFSQQFFTSNNFETIQYQSSFTLSGIESAANNPAGIVFSPDGIYFSLANSFSGNKTNIDATASSGSKKKYTSSDNNFIAPQVQVVYVKRNIGASLVLCPAKNNGNYESENGVYDFEFKVADLPAALTNAGIPTTGYKMNSSVASKNNSWHTKAALSIKVRELWSISGGLNLFLLSEQHQIFVDKMLINPILAPFGNGNYISASTFLSAADKEEWAQKTFNTTGTQTISGFGLAPFIGIYRQYKTNWMFSFLYEHSMVVDTLVTNDMEKNGSFRVTTITKHPTLITLGASYRQSAKISYSTSFSLGCPRKADYEFHGSYYSKTSCQFAIGTIYQPNNNWKLSGGYRFRYYGTDKNCHSQLNSLLPEHIIGGGFNYFNGFRWKIFSGIQVNFAHPQTSASNGAFSNQPTSTHFSSFGFTVMGGITYIL